MASRTARRSPSNAARENRFDFPARTCARDGLSSTVAIMPVALAGRGGAALKRTGGAGGNGGNPGAGGGGGGAALNGNASGAGGNGGRGEIRVTTFF